MVTSLIEEAERSIPEVCKRGRSGQVSASKLQSVRYILSVAHTGRTDWRHSIVFTNSLVHISPALGTRVGYAAAVAEAEGPEAEGTRCSRIDYRDAVRDFISLMGGASHVLPKDRKTGHASEAYDRDGLAEDPRGWSNSSSKNAGLTTSNNLFSSPLLPQI